MTNEEAMEIIEMAITEAEWNDPIEYAEAFMKAHEALVMQEKYRWHDLYDYDETERLPKIVAYDTFRNFSEAVDVVDEKGIYDTAMIVENHADGDCNKVYERFWYFGEGGKWEGFGSIRAWRYIKPL